MPRPLADDIRAAILTDIRAGKLSRNAIAKKHGVGAGTVTRLAQEAAGPTAFDRSKTVQATRAREADTASRRANLAARRIELAEALQSDAERLRAQLWQPHTYFDWGGKDHSFDTHTTKEPTPADKRLLMGAAATAVDRSLRLVPPQEDGAAESRSAIGDLLAGLAADYTARHGALPADTDADQ